MVIFFSLFFLSPIEYSLMAFKETLHPKMLTCFILDACWCEVPIHCEEMRTTAHLHSSLSFIPTPALIDVALSRHRWSKRTLIELATSRYCK